MNQDRRNRLLATLAIIIGDLTIVTTAIGLGTATNYLVAGHGYWTTLTAATTAIGLFAILRDLSDDLLNRIIDRLDPTTEADQ